MTGKHTGHVQIRGNFELGTFLDEEEIDAIVDKVRSDDYRFQSIVEHIVTSPSFTGNS